MGSHTVNILPPIVEVNCVVGVRPRNELVVIGIFLKIYFSVTAPGHARQ